MAGRISVNTPRDAIVAGGFYLVLGITLELFVFGSFSRMLPSEYTISLMIGFGSFGGFFILLGIIFLCIGIVYHHKGLDWREELPWRRGKSRNWYY